MKKFINEVAENMIYEDVISNFSDFDEKKIEHYIIENYGIIDENIMSRVVSKVKTGIAKTASSMKDWIQTRMDKIKAFYKASKIYPIITKNKDVFFKLTKDSDKTQLRTDSMGRAFLGSRYSSSDNSAVIVFGNPSFLSSKPSATNESKFLKKFSNELFEANLVAVDSAELDDRAQRGHELAPIAGVEGLKSIDDQSSKRFDKLRAAGFTNQEIEKELEEPSRSDPGFRDKTNIVNVRTLEWHIRSVLAEVVSGVKKNPPRIFIAGPPGTGKTALVSAFDGKPVVASADSEGGERTFGKWKVHILEVDKLFSEIFSGFPVETVIPVFKKVEDGVELTPEEQKKYREAMDHGSSRLKDNKEEINNNLKAAYKKDENIYKYNEKVIQLKQTDLFPDKNDPGYHIFFFDELNRGDSEKIGAVMNLLYAGKIGSSYHVPKNSCMIAAGNVGDGVIDFEKIKALYGTFFTRMERLFVTTYDWESRMVYGNKYTPNKQEYFTPGEKDPDKFDSVIADMGPEDVPIVTDALNELIKQYGNSFNYVVAQLNKDGEPYTLDYRWFTNLSNLIKTLAIRDWNKLPKKTKETYIERFNKIDDGDNTEEVTYTFGDKQKITYKTASFVSPVHMFMFFKQFDLFDEALDYTLSDAEEGQTIKQFILGKLKQKTFDKLSVNIEDLKYTLSVQMSDEKVKNTLLDENKDTFTGILHSIQSLIVKHKSPDSYWDKANQIIPNMDLAIKNSMKSKDISPFTKKLFKQILEADVKDDDKKNRELRIKRMKGLRLLAANISVIFDLQKGNKSGIAKIDYMQTIVTEIAKSKFAAADMSESDKGSIEKFTDNLNALLDEDEVFQATRIKTGLNLGSIKQAMEDAKKSAPDSFQIMSFLTTNPTAISNNTYLKISDVEPIVKEISSRYEQEYENPNAMTKRPDFHLSTAIPDIRERNFKKYMNFVGKEAGISDYASKLLSKPSDQEFRGVKLNAFELQRFLYNYEVMKIIIRKEKEMKKNWERYNRKEMENENKKIEKGFSIILEKMVKK